MDKDKTDTRKASPPPPPKPKPVPKPKSMPEPELEAIKDANVDKAARSGSAKFNITDEPVPAPAPASSPAPVSVVTGETNKKADIKYDAKSVSFDVKSAKPSLAPTPTASKTDSKSQLPANEKEVTVTDPGPKPKSKPDPAPKVIPAVPVAKKEMPVSVPVPLKKPVVTKSPEIPVTKIQSPTNKTTDSSIKENVEIDPLAPFKCPVFYPLPPTVKVSGMPRKKMSKTQKYRPTYKNTEGLSLYKLTLLGDASVGKFTLTTQLFFQHSFDMHRPEIDDHFIHKVEIDGKSNVLDVRIVKSGQYAEFEAMRKSYYYIREEDGFILVYSVTDRSSFESIEKYHGDILENKKLTAYPMLLVGTKADLENERVVSSREGQDLGEKLKIPFVETSTVENFNIDYVFHELVRIVQKSKGGNSTCVVL